MTNPVLLYITTPSKKEAEKIAFALMDARLIASANMLSGATSFYRWEGEVIHAEETVMIAKTREDLAADAVAMAEELHSYECPGILVLPIQSGSQAYLDWITEATGDEK